MTESDCYDSIDERVGAAAGFRETTEAEIIPPIDDDELLDDGE